ncbi:hypothetical protein FNF29_04988 [Cafeteria roenbergensis]|uniref:EF-hand domain-containing protein n=1 Tax=Cafeteria roenbergensis TaxID=33653 RepID=A0A5A8CE81_CAFRO|nr:hypothetical protein FNF29_04988 [Cafeteria roenbergensis]|eukprot:KAA0150874.1 hypothetical protein FNF29_04988 [Cafeteria roenbergensis]
MTGKRVSLACLRSLVEALVDRHPVLEWPWRHDARLRSAYVTVVVCFFAALARGPGSTWISSSDVEALGVRAAFGRARSPSLAGLVPFDPRYVMCHVIRFEMLDRDGDGLIRAADMRTNRASSVLTSSAVGVDMSAMQPDSGSAHDDGDNDDDDDDAAGSGVELLRQPPARQGDFTECMSDPEDAEEGGADEGGASSGSGAPSSGCSGKTRLPGQAEQADGVEVTPRARRQTERHARGAKRRSTRPAAQPTRRDTPHSHAPPQPLHRTPAHGRQPRAATRGLGYEAARLEALHADADSDPVERDGGQGSGTRRRGRRSHTDSSRHLSPPPALILTPVPSPSRTPHGSHVAGTLPIAATSPLMLQILSEADARASRTRWQPARLLRSPAVAAADVTLAINGFPRGPACIIPPFYLDRVMAGAATGGTCSGVSGVFNFEDFVRFSLAQADRMATTSAAYWLDVLDTDSSGVLGRGAVELAAHHVREERARLHPATSVAVKTSLSPAAAVATVRALADTRRHRRFGSAAAGSGADSKALLTPGTFSGPGCESLGQAIFGHLLGANGCEGLVEASLDLGAKFPAGLAAELPILDRRPASGKGAGAGPGAVPFEAVEASPSKPRTVVVGAATSAASRQEFALGADGQRQLHGGESALGAAAPTLSTPRRSLSSTGPPTRQQAVGAESGLPRLGAVSFDGPRGRSPSLLRRHFHSSGVALPPSLSIPGPESVPGM